MRDERNDDIEGKMELDHQGIPIYRSVFFVSIAVGVLYLGTILLVTL